MGHRIPADNLVEDQTITVQVNGRAEEHLGVEGFEATVVDIMAGEIVLEPVQTLQDETNTHTWYPSSGYLHGYHDSAGRGATDIGKVNYVESTD